LLRLRETADVRREAVAALPVLTRRATARCGVAGDAPFFVTTCEAGTTVGTTETGPDTWALDTAGWPPDVHQWGPAPAIPTLPSTTPATSAAEMAATNFILLIVFTPLTRVRRYSALS